MKVPAASSIPGTVEAKFAKRLAGNEKKIRDRAFKQLKLYMIAKSEKAEGSFSRDELMRLWKGLFYCMWMSDKPLVQEELAKNMAEILPKLKDTKASMLYFETFLATMAREWRGIDRLRMDKFYLLTRFMLSQAFACMKQNLWDEGLVDWMLSILKNGPLSPLSPTPGVSSGSPLGLRLHFIDIYIEELTDCGHDCLSTSQVTKFLLPYCLLLCNTPVRDLRTQVANKVFQEIVDHSDVVQQAVAAHIGDDEVVPEIVLKCDYAEIADSLFELASKKEAYARNRLIVYEVIRKLREVAEGRLPLDDVPDIPEDLDREKNEMKIAEDRLTSKLFKEMAREHRESQKTRKLFRKKSKKLNNGLLQDESMMFDGEAGEEPLADINQEEFDGENEDEIVAAEKKVVKKSRKKKKAKKAAGGSMSKSVLIGSALEKETDDSKQVQNNGDSSELDTTMQELLDKKETKKAAKASKQDVNEMMLDLVDKPNSHFEENCTKKRVVKSKNKRKISSINSNSEENSIEPKEKYVKVSIDKFDETKCSLRKSLGKTKRKEIHNLLKQKLLSSDGNSSCEPSEKDTNEKTKVATTPKKKKVKHPLLVLDDSEQELLLKEERSVAHFTSSAAPKAAFLRVAASKVNKQVTKTPKNTPKRESREAQSASAKRVSFQMSKIQVQPFKKNDRSSVLSPSPLTIPFDPKKTPDFGLLKQKRVIEQKSKSVPKRKRARAADFFQ